MKLVYAQPSPFVRKAMVLLEQAGQTGAVELVDGFGSPVAPSDNAIAANPVGKIPCLILDDGTTIYDSRVITRYLDKKFNLSMYPDGDAEFTTLTLEAHADAVLDACILCVYEIRCRDEAIHSAEWLTGQRGKVNRGLDALEKNWIPHLKGQIDIGHIAVGCLLGYLDFRVEMGGWGDWRTNRPQLTTWGEEFLQRPVMKTTAPV